MRDLPLWKPKGYAVALIGSGDAGVYGMASPALEDFDGTFDVVGVPGITAATAAASLLGAPMARSLFDKPF